MVSSPSSVIDKQEDTTSNTNTNLGAKLGLSFDKVGGLDDQLNDIVRRVLASRYVRWLLRFCFVLYLLLFCFAIVLEVLQVCSIILQRNSKLAYIGSSMTCYAILY